MGNSLTKIISMICATECVYCPHKDGCERGDWNKTSRMLAFPTKVGADKECPLMQFKAEKEEIKSKGPMPTAYRFTITDTWRVCEKCKFSKTIDGEINLDDAYMDHCLDCACNQLREAMEENAAEARCS